MLLVRQLQLPHRTVVSLTPGLAKQAHSRLGVCSEQEGSGELRAELGCRQQNVWLFVQTSPVPGSHVS